MKINRPTAVLLALTPLLLTNLPAAAQEDSNPTNSAPPLKELMATNSVVTNTVGIVLVKISDGLWAGKFETTQDAYEKVVHSNPSQFLGGEKPVDSVSWNAAMEFCQKLTDTEKADLPDGYKYSLPTQSQWLTLMGNASLSDAVMKLNGNYSSTETVGSKGANNLGLYDTRGNVMEWCLDPLDQPYRVLRGGAWDTFLDVNARPEFLWKTTPEKALNSFGFRVVLAGSAK